MITTTNQKMTQLEQFYQALLTDSVLQDRLKTATDPESLCDLAVRLGQEEGFHFSKEEVLAAMAIESAMGEETLAVENLKDLGQIVAYQCGCLDYGMSVEQ